MARKGRIGIIYNYSSDWIGGSYYVQNLIRSLSILPKKEQLKIHVLTSDKKALEDLKQVTGYANMTYVSAKISYNKFESFINRVWGKLFRRKLIHKKINLDCLFPLFEVPNTLKHIKDLIFWIPDLQEKYLQDFFSKEDVAKRHDKYLDMINSNGKIVFSSQSALNDFNSFYPFSKNPKVVIPFAVSHPDISSLDIIEVKNKYGLEDNYFFSPNQFWQHKNHVAIIEAVNILAKKGIIVNVCFTGKEHDHRNPNYTESLKQKVKNYGLEQNVRFLGFIDRRDQLVLMKHAIAVIQPSLFEGWSTVVEDAKALNQSLIVSNIAVHKEQLEDYAYYFDPNDYDLLAKTINNVIQNGENKLRYTLDYSQNIKEFALKVKLLTSTE